MKRLNNIYSKIYDIENLRLAHKMARQDKSHYFAIQKIDTNPDYYLYKIQDMLKNKTYKVSPYKISIIQDSGKEREIMKLPYYPDRIIQWAIMLQLESMFVKHFCNHSCASIKNAGITKASKLTRKYLKDTENTQYCLKIDIKKFYPNIDQTILKQLLRKKIKDKNTLELLDTIISSCNKGIPIGSYLSQYLSNFYLSQFDHWCKETLKIPYIIRYMDDIVIFGQSKEVLWYYLEVIQDYLKSNLHLDLKSNYQIFPVDVRGVDFVGYRHYHNRVILRKRNYKNIRKFIIKMLYKSYYRDKAYLPTFYEFCVFFSYKGIVDNTTAINFINKYFRTFYHSMELYKICIIRRKELERYEKYRYRARQFGAGQTFDYWQKYCLCS